eukprot:gb/GEZN01007844.1/.p1 GENE.gb/GEZN01007844.1/~~gb/GEZN01007844.1/.p1  ORF type:complete len:393 (+),score=15.42 gb/GEZN01007844.1/:226-1404(+)
MVFLLVCFPYTFGELTGLPKFSGEIFRTYWPSNLKFQDGFFNSRYTAANSWFETELINNSGFTRWTDLHDIWRYRNYSSVLNRLSRRYYTEYFDAKLSGEGMITTADAGFQVYSCYGASKNTNLSCSDVPLDIVISVAWNWGESHYHFPAECVSPISWLLDLFPNVQEKVYIHVKARTGYQIQWLEMIGIPSSRVVSGPICARRLLLASSECGRVGIPQVLSLRKRLLDRLNSNTTTTTTATTTSTTTTTIIRTSTTATTTTTTSRSNDSSLPLIINRSGRTYGNWRNLWSRVPHAAHDDNGLGNVDTQLRRFAFAHMIIAVHGAGAVNMITAQPGACFFEFFPMPNHFNPCFFTLAASLGFRYWGYGIINMTKKHVDEVLKHRAECIPKFK